MIDIALRLVAASVWGAFAWLLIGILVFRIFGNKNEPGDLVPAVFISLIPAVIVYFIVLFG